MNDSSNYCNDSLLIKLIEQNNQLIQQNQRLIEQHEVKDEIILQVLNENRELLLQLAERTESAGANMDLDDGY